MQWRKYSSKLPAVRGAISGTVQQPCSAHIPICKHLTRVTHAGSLTCLTINVTNDSLWNSLKSLHLPYGYTKVSHCSHPLPIVQSHISASDTAHLISIYALYNNTRDFTLKQSPPQKKKTNGSETFKVTITVFATTHLLFLAPNYNFLFYDEEPFMYVNYWCFFFHIH